MTQRQSLQLAYLLGVQRQHSDILLKLSHARDDVDEWAREVWPAGFHGDMPLALWLSKVVDATLRQWAEEDSDTAIDLCRWWCLNDYRTLHPVVFRVPGFHMQLEPDSDMWCAYFAHYPSLDAVPQWRRQFIDERGRQGRLTRAGTLDQLIRRLVEVKSQLKTDQGAREFLGYDRALPPNAAPTRHVQMVLDFMHAGVTANAVARRTRFGRQHVRNILKTYLAALEMNPARDLRE
jgi:hypothetical protein